MKLFQKFLRRRLTPVEQLAEYESQIAYNQTIINNAETQIELTTNLIPCFPDPDDKMKLLEKIEGYTVAMEKASAELEYYQVLRNDLQEKLSN